MSWGWFGVSCLFGLLCFVIVSCIVWVLFCCFRARFRYSYSFKFLFIHNYNCFVGVFGGYVNIMFVFVLVRV